MHLFSAQSAYFLPNVEQIIPIYFLGLFYSPSTMTTQSVLSEPSLLLATHLYLPLSLGWQLMISMVITPSVWVIGYTLESKGLPD